MFLFKTATQWKTLSAQKKAEESNGMNQQLKVFLRMLITEMQNDVCQANNGFSCIYCELCNEVKEKLTNQSLQVTKKASEHLGIDNTSLQKCIGGKECHPFEAYSISWGFDGGDGGECTPKSFRGVYKGHNI